MRQNHDYATLRLAQHHLCIVVIGLVVVVVAVIGHRGSQYSKESRKSSHSHSECGGHEKCNGNNVTMMIGLIVIASTPLQSTTRLLIQ